MGVWQSQDDQHRSIRVFLAAMQCFVTLSLVFWVAGSGASLPKSRSSFAALVSRAADKAFTKQHWGTAVHCHWLSLRARRGHPASHFPNSTKGWREQPGGML